jgi:hypothetical protein
MSLKANYRKPVYGLKKKAEAKGEEPRVDAGRKKNFIEELDILDYAGKRNARAFDEAKKKLEVYVARHFDVRNAHIFKHNANYEFEELAEVDNELFNAENDPHGFAKDLRRLQNKERFTDMKKFNENNKKIYAILWAQCTNNLQHRIEMDEDFAEYDAEQDLSRLWGRIAELLMTGAGERQNVMMLKVKTQSEFEKVRQFKNESVGDFYHRFNNEIISLEACDIEIPDQPELAMKFLDKLDITRYAPLLAEMENAENRGQNIYPLTVVDAMIRAQNYKIVAPQRYDGNHGGVAFNVTTADKAKANKYADNKKYENKKQNPQKGPKEPNVKDAAANGKKSDLKCWICGDPNHFRNKCPKFLEANEEVHVTFCCNTMRTEEEKKYNILADNQATVSIFKERSLLKNVRKIKDAVTINGIGGEISVDEVGDYDFFGEVYYSPKASANVLCFYDLQMKFDLAYDRNTFTVSLPDGRQILFEPEGKLYVYNDPPEVKGRIEHCNVQTVKENEMIYTKREVNAAKQAQELMRKFGYPSTADIIKMISNGVILNCPVTQS